MLLVNYRGSTTPSTSPDLIEQKLDAFIADHVDECRGYPMTLGVDPGLELLTEQNAVDRDKDGGTNEP